MSCWVPRAPPEFSQVFPGPRALGSRKPPAHLGLHPFAGTARLAMPLPLLVPQTLAWSPSRLTSGHARRGGTRELAAERRRAAGACVSC